MCRKHHIALAFCVVLLSQKGAVNSEVKTDSPYGSPNTITGGARKGVIGGMMEALASFALPEMNQRQSGLVSYEEFANGVEQALSGYPRPPPEKYNAFTQGLPKGDIKTKQEAAMALAQILHESHGLQTKEEYPENRRDYSEPDCDAPNKLYYGRGYIQLTGCKNYRKASVHLFQNGDILVNDPDSVARDEQLAWDTAFDYWRYAVHTQPGVAEGLFGVTTRAINGKNECDGADTPTARKRYEMYGRIRAAWSLPGPGIENGCYN